MSATAELARFAADLTPELTPVAARRRTVALLLDAIGVALGGRDTPPIAVIEAALRKLAGRSDAATVLGTPERWSPRAAALLNGALIHALDFDDTHTAAVMHPSAPIVPAALAAAEMSSASGARVITGIVAGYEAALRIARAVNPESHFDRGFHSTATCGTYGAAAAAGNVLGLTPAQMESAFGLCGSQAAGNSQFILEGAWNKPFQVGAAAANGLTAAVLAGDGFRGATQALEGSRGFLRGYSDAWDADCLVQGLGEHWQTLEIGIKPYPCCRHIHAPLDALLEWTRDHDLDAAAVTAVRIGVSAQSAKAVGSPADFKRRVRSVAEGQFSMHFCAAVALLTGDFTPRSYSLAGDADVDALCDRVHVYVGDYADARYPKHVSAEVELETTTARYRAVVADLTGEPHTFPSPVAQRKKFRSLATGLLADGGADRLADRIDGCDSPAAIADVLRASVPDGH